MNTFFSCQIGWEANCNAPQNDLSSSFLPRRHWMVKQLGSNQCLGTSTSAWREELRSRPEKKNQAGGDRVLNPHVNAIAGG